MSRQNINNLLVNGRGLVRQQEISSVLDKIPPSHLRVTHLYLAEFTRVMNAMRDFGLLDRNIYFQKGVMIQMKPMKSCNNILKIHLVAQ